jgi:hypothetical protein
MTETKEGIITSVIDEHSEKALNEINITEDGIEIVASEVHPEKVYWFIVTIVVGIETEIKLMQ